MKKIGTSKICKSNSEHIFKSYYLTFWCLFEFIATFFFPPFPGLEDLPKAWELALPFGGRCRVSSGFHTVHDHAWLCGGRACFFCGMVRGREGREQPIFISASSWKCPFPSLPVVVGKDQSNDKQPCRQSDSLTSHGHQTSKSITDKLLRRKRNQIKLT